jgi:hypothetical protein
MFKGFLFLGENTKILGGLAMLELPFGDNGTSCILGFPTLHLAIILWYTKALKEAK